jgi:hypothetical protein
LRPARPAARSPAIPSDFHCRCHRLTLCRLAFSWRATEPCVSPLANKRAACLRLFSRLAKSRSCFLCTTMAQHDTVLFQCHCIMRDSIGVAISPDGSGLPEGSGTVVAGREIFKARCSKCHGDKAEGAVWPTLVGGQGTLATAKPLKTVGSYWPYATTVWDYINRAMPFDQPGVLKPAEVYAVVAYILNLNGIIGNDQAMDAKSLPKGFVSDPRPDVGNKAKH